MALTKRRSSYFKSGQLPGGKVPTLVEWPPFGQGFTLTEKMYARKFEKSESGSSQCSFDYSAFAMQGFRTHMQDDYQCLPNHTMGLSKEPYAAFAVYDGHGVKGHYVSSHCAQTFLDSIYGRKALRTAKSITTDLVTASIHKTFLKFDQQLRDEQGLFVVPGTQPLTGAGSQLPLQYGGTTATTVLISDQHIVFANLGDSRTILCRNDKIEYETKDHSPSVEEEEKRIKAAGGRVHTNPHKHTVILDPDLNGNCDFSISRAIGDFAFKVPTDKPPVEYIVSPVPDIHVLERNYQEDQFLLLASDGIFKSLSSETVVKFVLRQLQSTSDITSICKNLALMAYYSYDNIPDDTTLVLIVFPAAPEINRDVLKKEELCQKQALQEMERELQELVTNAEDVRVLDNEFSIFLNLTKKLPPEYKVQLRMDFFRDTLDTLRVGRYGQKSSKRAIKYPAASNHGLTVEANEPEGSCNGDKPGGYQSTDDTLSSEGSLSDVTMAKNQADEQDSVHVVPAQPTVECGDQPGPAHNTDVRDEV